MTELKPLLVIPACARLSDGDTHYGRIRLYLKEVPNKGLGVFCKDPIQPGDLIERCPTLYLPPEQTQIIEKTGLANYYFIRNDGGPSFALGYGSLYNHSYHANANFRFTPDEKTIEIYAVKPIPADTEITFNYNGEPDCQDPIWFQACE
jgi:SET domain-containing protein